MKKIYLLLLAVTTFSAASYSQTIFAIQTPGTMSDTSAFFGQVVTTSGIVTAKRTNGYFIQDGTGAWNGIFVFNNTNNPVVGDNVTITGTVDEFNRFTEIKTITAFTVNSSGNTLPASTSVSTLAANSEMYEGVLVTVTNASSTTAVNGFGEWIVDDNSGPVIIDNSMFSFTPVVGNQYTVTGVVEYAFSTFRIQPRNAADVTGQVATTPFVSIFNIQNTTAPNGDSPQNGNIVKTKGVVTGIVNFGTTSAVGTFFIQDGNGAWNGIYVFNNTNPVAIGDSVEVTGEVDEFNFTTELINVTNVTVLNSGNTLPTPAIATTLAANSEMYEGVLIQVKNAVYVNNPGSFGLWELNDGTGIIQADDDIFPYANIANVGSTYDVTGIGHFSFGTAKILPRSVNDISLSTSINEVEQIAVSIYPNPANDVITFELGINSFEVTITDITGKIIKTATSTSNKKIINIADLNNGVYFYTIIANKNVVTTSKFIVVR